VSAEGNSILIVDDDEPVRTGIVNFLRARGLVVFEPGTMQAAEQEFRERLPDLAIVDHCLSTARASS
jgi:DNA-binding response OmpR family regulator